MMINRNLKKVLIAGFILLLCFSLANAEVQFNGHSTDKYQLRSGAGESDNDFYNTTYLNLSFDKLSDLSFSIYGRASYDIDGDDNPRGYYPFDDVTDSFKSDFNARIYSAYLNYNNVGPLEYVRLGRQFSYESTNTYFDGVRVSTIEVEKKTKLKFYTYLGIPVNLYEASNSGDFVGALGCSLKPWRYAKFSVDWSHIKDKNLYGEPKTDLITVNMWHTITKQMNLFVKYSIIDSHSYNNEVRVNFNLSKMKLTGSLSILTQYSPVTGFAYQYDDFYYVLGEFQPYTNYNLSLSKVLTDDFVVSAGSTIRTLENDDKEGTFNHEYTYFYLTPTYTMMNGKLDMSANYYLYNTEDDDVSDFNINALYRYSDKLDFSAGTRFSMYEYDYFTGAEKDNINSIFLGSRWKISKKYRLDCDYSYEDDDYDTYHVLQTALKVTF